MKKVNVKMVMCFLIGFLFVLTSCNPGIYKKPAENFHMATVGLKEAYFLELELSNKATIEKFDLENQISIWNADTERIDVDKLKRYSDKMKAKKLENIHRDLEPLRKKAFEAIEGYSNVLISLSSDEPTDAIVSEMNGLINDINGIIEITRKVDDFASIADKAEEIMGPLQQYVAVFIEIAKIISDIARERAIANTIGKANIPILELFDVLHEEALYAQKNFSDELENSKKKIERYALGSPKFVEYDTALKAKIANRLAEINTILESIQKERINESFKAAKIAQGALVEKALLKDPKNWTVHIRAFKESVSSTQTEIKKLKEMM